MDPLRKVEAAQDYTKSFDACNRLSKKFRLTSANKSRERVKMGVRRVVTGHNNEGKAIFASDEIVEVVGSTISSLANIAFPSLSCPVTTLLTPIISLSLDFFFKR